MTLNSLKFPIIFIFATLSATAKLSSSSPIENNDVQLVLTARIDSLLSKMDQFVTRLDEEKILRGHLQLSNAELEKKLHQLATDNSKQKELFEAKINVLTAHNTQQDKEINLLKSKINKNAADTIQSAKPLLDEEDRRKNGNEADYLINDDSSPRSPPSSCRQLSTIGHYLDGIYLVANPDTKKIETVYCDFGTGTLSETLFGSVDVKSQSVHFYVQKNKDFTVTTGVIPFDIERLNVGGAMNLASGVFTVPVDGIYHFEFSGLKDTDVSTYLYIELQVNGANIGGSYAQYIGPNIRHGLSSINASLRLKTGDQVRLLKGIGTLDDDNAHYTHFTGWLVEEDLHMLV